MQQLEFHWTHLRRRLSGLSDDEYFWEPVSGWSLRIDDAGVGILDRVDPEPTPPPFTTIAWRMCHLVGDVLGSRANVAALDTEQLQRRALPADVGYHGPSMASLVLHINREVIHHGAEICCLRDLYRDWVDAN